MKKFNNTLVGTDCGDAGLPARDIAKAKPILRVVPRPPNSGSVVIQFLERRDRYGARASLPRKFHGLALRKSTDVDTPNGADVGADGAGSRDPSHR
jgi:hypothetical protein